MKKHKWYPWVFFLLIYLINFMVALRLPGFSLGEVLGTFVVIGIIFSSVAYLLFRKNPPPHEALKTKSGETLLLAGVLILVSISLIFGNKIITAWQLQPLFHTSEIENLIFTLLWKVIIFMLMPFLCYKILFGFKLKEFGFLSKRKEIFSSNNILAFVVLGGLFILLQLFGGKAAEPVTSGKYTAPELVIGLPVVFLWLFIEVGLVEEFFFRAMLQERISAITKSSSWGIVISCLLFGLAHAPGMYYRGAGVVEGLGSSPSFIVTVCYCIAVQSTAGLPLSIIWSKTKNIWLLMALHATIDLLSSYPGLMKIVGY